MKFQHTFSLLALLATTSAHSIFVQLTAGGVTNPVGYGIRDPSYDGPIQDVTSNYLACNGGSNPTTASPNIISVKAGETVQATWRHTLTSTAANDAVYVIDPSHHGPLLAYLKKTGSTSGSSLTDVGYGPGWFKIQHSGYNPSTNVWAVDTLIAAGGVQNITIPSCIEDGEYLLRAELIALHAASSSGGAQLYMECAQISVTGGTGTASPATVSLPGAYSASDPGILINIYQTLTSYTIPGPTPFVCGAGGSASTSSAVKVATSTTATTLVTATSSKVASSSTSAAGAPLYGQCGGTGWTGATTCASGTCKVSSAYYSQCLP